MAEEPMSAAAALLAVTEDERLIHPCLLYTSDAADE